jgi:hypothetical protein
MSQPILSSESTISYWWTEENGLEGYTYAIYRFEYNGEKYAVALDANSRVTLLRQTVTGDSPASWQPVYSSPDAYPANAFFVTEITPGEYRIGVTYDTLQLLTLKMGQGIVNVVEAVIDGEESDNIYLYALRYINGWWYLFYGVATTENLSCKYAVSRSADGPFTYYATVHATESLNAPSTLMAVSRMATSELVLEEEAFSGSPPSVVYHGGYYKVWWLTQAGTDLTIHYTESADCETWSEDATDVVDVTGYEDVCNPCVRPGTMAYDMVCSATADMELHTLHLVSADGLEWELDTEYSPPTGLRFPQIGVPGGSLIYGVMGSAPSGIYQTSFSGEEWSTPEEMLPAGTEGVYDIAGIVHPFNFIDVPLFCYTGEDAEENLSVIMWLGALTHLKIAAPAEAPKALKVGDDYELWYMPGKTSGELRRGLTYESVGAYSPVSGGLSLALTPDRELKFSLTVPEKAVYMGTVAVDPESEEDANGVLPLVFTVTTRLSGQHTIYNTCITDYPSVLAWIGGDKVMRLA